MIIYLNEGVLNESIGGDSVEEAINNRLGVLITYKSKADKSNKSTGVRYIEPYVYGLTSKGNEAVRAYQYYGDSKKGTPSWKLLRLDSIESWEVTSNTFELEPKARGWAAQAFNGNDKSLPVIYCVVDLNQSGNESDIDVLRSKTRMIKNSKPVNINDINSRKNGNVTGPIDAKKPEVGIENTETTSRNTNSPLNTDGTDKKNTSTPPVKQEPKENGPIISNATDPNEHNANELMSNSDFRDMIRRNIDLTRKEKEKRNLDLGGNVLKKI